MGNSGSQKCKEGASFLPTGVQIGKATLSSPWWAAQKSHDIPPPVALHAYGTEYAQAFNSKCGQFKADLHRCIQGSKKDPLNTTGWYPTCGLHYELETHCTTQFIEHLDRKCAGQFEKGLGAVRKEEEAQGMDRVIAQIAEGSKQFPELKAMGRCVKSHGPQMPAFNDAAAQARFTQNTRHF